MNLKFSTPEFRFSSSENHVKDAFHGTSRELSEAIRKEGYKCQKGNHLHLGDGVYFYEGCQESAEWWARHAKKFKEVVVLQSSITLGRCIDFTKRQHKSALRNFATGLQQRIDKSPAVKAALPSLTDGAVINLAAKLASADTVRAAYTETEGDQGNLIPVYPKSIFAWSSRLVICVRKTEQITSTKIAQN